MVAAAAAVPTVPDDAADEGISAERPKSNGGGLLAHRVCVTQQQKVIDSLQQQYSQNQMQMNERTRFTYCG